MAAEVVMRALKHVWLTLQPLNLPMAVMGGLALAAWQHIRATQDVDLLLGIQEQDVAGFLERLAVAKIYPKHEPAILSVGQLRIVQLLYEAPGTYLDIQIDLLIAQSEYHQAAIARRIATPLPGLESGVFVVSCEDLILLKLLGGRLIDRADAAALLRLNRPTLDLAYLMRWVGELQLDTEFGEIWKDALPGETCPVTN
jgi:hypothetical protein